jgi:hypothetical protein
MKEYYIFEVIDKSQPVYDEFGYEIYLRKGSELILQNGKPLDISEVVKQITKEPKIIYTGRLPSVAELRQDPNKNYLGLKGLNYDNLGNQITRSCLGPSILEDFKEQGLEVIVKELE